MAVQLLDLLLLIIVSMYAAYEAPEYVQNNFILDE